MTETIQTAMDRLMTISVEPQDYVAEDGLLYCGSCKTPKEAFFPNGKKLFGRDRHPAECQCRQEARKKQEEEEQKETRKPERKGRHPKYGEGEIISEDEMMIELEFPGYGKKQFLKAFGEVEVLKGL